ncbi:MAG: hypothetical protein WBM44_22790 [Waterburya sp.]
MNIIVKHSRTGNEYILLGINGEIDKANPSRFISELFNQEKSDVSCSVTVCDVQGNIFLAYIDDLIVTEIDGKKLTEILPEASYESVKQNSYSEETKKLEIDEELEEEDFTNDQDTDTSTSTSTNPPTSFVSGQSSSTQSNVSEDDDDWI